MGAGKILVIIGALLSIVGTFVFALFDPDLDVLGSGLGYAVNIPILFENADNIALLSGLEVFIVYILLIVFIIFLAAGFLQLVGLKSRVVGQSTMSAISAISSIFSLVSSTATSQPLQLAAQYRAILGLAILASAVTTERSQSSYLFRHLINDGSKAVPF